MEYIPLIAFFISVFSFLYCWFLIGEQGFEQSEKRRKLKYEFEKQLETIGKDINILRFKLKSIDSKQSRRLDIHLHDEPKPKLRGKESLIPPRSV